MARTPEGARERLLPRPWSWKRSTTPLRALGTRQPRRLLLCGEDSRSPDQGMKFLKSSLTRKHQDSLPSSGWNTAGLQELSPGPFLLATAPGTSTGRSPARREGGNSLLRLPAPGMLWPAWLWVGEKVPSRGGRAQLQPKTRAQKRGVLGGEEMRTCKHEKRRVGKRDQTQQLQRFFNFISIINFISVITSHSSPLPKKL